MRKLENKVAVVTGGNSGIGLATAILFTENGAKVAITGRDKKTIDDAVKEIGNGAIGIVSDVSEIKTLDAQYKKVSDSFGKIDVLVVNAGVYISGTLIDFTEDQFDQATDINFKGVFFSVQKALPYLNDGASIILTSSASSEMGVGGVSVYSATKAAVYSLAKAFSTELADRGIRVNIISPGPVETPIMKRGGATKEQIEDLKVIVSATTVIGRMAKPEEIAEGFLYLASDDSKYMLGSELLLDGGMRIK
jgi:NAD(P)-dependent dehydrogenase (short-subunit alcohol dehydrogenase family)